MVFFAAPSRGAGGARVIYTWDIVHPIAVAIRKPEKRRGNCKLHNIEAQFPASNERSGPDAPNQRRVRSTMPLRLRQLHACIRPAIRQHRARLVSQTVVSHYSPHCALHSQSIRASVRLSAPREQVIQSRVLQYAEWPEHGSKHHVADWSEGAEQKARSNSRNKN